MNRLERIAAALGATGMAAGAAIGLSLAFMAQPASAHVETTAGSYDIEVGWNVEPTYAGQPNAVFLSVKDDAGKPVDDIGKDLHVVLSTGNQKSEPLAFQSAGEDSPGDFIAPVIPTTPGVYTFQFNGSINRTAFDKSFTASDSTFDEVVDPRTAQFPVKTPTPAELSTKVSRASARIDTASSKASSASDDASSAKTIGIVALIAAVVLGGGGIVIGLMGRRSSAR